MMPKGFPARSMSSVPTKAYPTQPFSPRMSQPSGLDDEVQEQSGPVPTPSNLLRPTVRKSPMAAKVRAALMMKLRGGK